MNADGERHTRRFGITRKVGQPLFSFRTDEALKAHPSYIAAKSGDKAAAVRLVRGLVSPDLLAAAAQRFRTDVLYTPVIALERNGFNAIPDALAQLYASATGARAGSDIVQANRAYHTGARPMDRLLVRPRFDGPVRRGEKHVLVDDVSVLGSTLAEIADHILRGGGEVVGTVTLVSASRSGKFPPELQQTREVERRFGDAVRELFGIDPAALTADEAAYLLNFRDADALRTRAAAAAIERSARLRARGVPGSGAKDPF
jgi:adenine/guanine phosphoribosyltransferase-like PRPP-binding protein